MKFFNKQVYLFHASPWHLLQGGVNCSGLLGLAKYNLRCITDDAPTIGEVRKVKVKKINNSILSNRIETGVECSFDKNGRAVF